jgi:16S rRNA (guanine527-N7)-methyltransferase
MSVSTVQSILERGLDTLEIDRDTEFTSKLLEYLVLLQHWNRAYNLTAVRDPEQMVVKHLLDSLAVAQYLPSQAQRLIDVGTGAGLPGIPLALLNPQQHYDLLDSNGKKTRFLFQVKTALGLANMAVLHARVESWAPPQAYDVVLSRAFASLTDMVNGCSHLCSERGCFLAMKGQRPEDELVAVAAMCEVRHVYQLQVPGLEEDRHLVELGPLSEGSQGNQFG